MHTFYCFDGQSNAKLLFLPPSAFDFYWYRAFGERITPFPTVTNPFRYKGAVGYYLDPPTGDLYIRARSYNAVLGRWLSRDPLLYYFVDGEENAYSYVANSPLYYSDPSGLVRECRTGCCKVESFSVDPKVAECSFKRGQDGQIVYTAPFKVSAKFLSAPPSHSCDCCSYRQQVKGFVRHREFPDGAWIVDREVTVFEEDCIPDENGDLLCYGHREAAERPNDVYSRPDRATGCEYAHDDKPGAYNLGQAISIAARNGRRLEVELNLDFRLIINDYCCIWPEGQRVYPVTDYPVKCTGRISPRQTDRG